MIHTDLSALDAAIEARGGHDAVLARELSRLPPDMPEPPLEAYDDGQAAVAPALPKRTPDPLSAMAAWIVTEDQVAKMEATRLIWRDVIALAHVAAWVSPANGGKTTIAKAAAADLASDGYQVMFFQEDASAGDLPDLFDHAKDHGYKLLNSTLSGSDPEQQVEVLQGLAQDGADLGSYVLIFDTLKKYSDLMSKRGSREFFKTMRALSQRGATVLLLGHTNKHRDPAGKLVFEGVGDVRNDVDELVYIESTEKDAQGFVTLTMTPDKVRAKVKPLSFRLDTHRMRLEPMDRVVDVAARNRADEQRRADQELIGLVTKCLRNGGKNRTQLVVEVYDLARGTSHSRRDVERVIAEYCSTDPTSPTALWIETRMRMNNGRHIGLKPELSQ